MTDIPKINQVPIQQPMYVNGALHLTWIRFFESLGIVADKNDEIDISTLQSATQSLTRQVGVINSDIIDLQNDIAKLSSRVSNLSSQISSINNSIIALNHANNVLTGRIVDIEKTQGFALISAHLPQTQEIPPVQAVFLCPEQSFSMVGLPTGEVIHD